MSTASSFTRRITISDISQPCKSVGAHLAAKLDSFSTDERTLTDELCDMLCIWLGMSGGLIAPLVPNSTNFTITLTKTTSAKEVRNGADLELEIQSPLGIKRCLIQAKVLDPETGKLRCDSKPGWKKLRKQLVKARTEVGDLGFLLIYVPGRLLNGRDYGYCTYEQSVLKTSGGTEAFFGATLIAIDDLLGPSGRWRYLKLKVPQTTQGRFKNGIPLWKFLLELMLCRRGMWNIEAHSEADRISSAFQSLTVSIGEISASQWREFQNISDQWLLNEDNESTDDQEG